MLHLLREDSVERAMERFPDAPSIYQRSIAAQAKLWRQPLHNRKFGAISQGAQAPGHRMQRETAH